MTETLLKPAPRAYVYHEGHTPPHTQKKIKKITDVHVNTLEGLAVFLVCCIKAAQEKNSGLIKHRSQVL